MKVLFAIGICVRLLHTDSWMAPTWKIEEVGKYSYRTVEVSNYSNGSLAYENIILFRSKTEIDQRGYERVTCPK